MLVLNVKLNEGVTEKRIWTPREVVEDIKQHNPQFVGFLKDFQLGLA